MSLATFINNKISTAAPPPTPTKITAASIAAAQSNPLSSIGINPQTTSGSTPALPTAPSILNNYLPAKGQSIGDFIKNAVLAVPGSFASVVGQPILRQLGAAATTIDKLNPVSGIQPFTPTGQFQEDLFGTNQPLTFTRAGQETLGLDTSKAPTTPLGKIGLPIVGLAGTLANFDGGGAVGDAAKLTSALKAASTVDDTSRILKIAGASDEAIHAYAPLLAQTKDETAIKDTLSAIRNIDSAKSTAPAAMDIPRTVRQTSVDVPEVASRVPEVAGEASQVASKAGQVSDDVTHFNPDEYVKAMTDARDAAAAVDKPGVRGAVGSFLRNAKTKLVDFSAPIEDTLNAATKKAGINLLPSQDIHNQIDRVLRAPTLAGQFAKDNGLADVIKTVDDPSKLDQYLTAKHALDLSDKGIETGRNLTKDAALVNAYAPKYEKDAQTIYNYSHKLLDYGVQSGLINQNLADTLKARYPNYVPFQRVFSELEKGTGNYGNKAVASLSSQNLVKSIEGSTRQIESPLESLLAKTNDVVKQGEKNQAGKLLASYKDLPGNPFQLKELPKGESSPYTISYLENGVKHTFSTTKEIAEAAKALNVQQMNILGQIFAIPTRVARIGITGLNIPFTASNLVKDQLSAFINSDKALNTSLANPYNFVRSLFSAVKHDDLYEEVVRAGGGGTSFDLARNQVPETVKAIRSEKNVGTALRYRVTHPAQLLRDAEDLIGRSEEATRIQQYRGTKIALMNKGMSPEEATIAAARAARENTVNFARRGEWGTVLNSAFLYLNAGIQGNRTLLRTIKDRPIATATKLAVGAFFPVAAATAWNLNDPARADAYKDIPDYEKQNNLILVPPNPTRDKDGNWNVIKIPISQELNNIVGLARKPIEQAFGLDPIKFKDIASALVGTVSPLNVNFDDPVSSVASDLTPQAIKPTLEAYTNKNFFTGFPEVPQSLQNLSPQNQVNPNTSPIATAIADRLGTSPIKTQDFITETGGGVASQLLGVQNPISGSLARFTKAASGAVDEGQFNDLNAAKTQAADASAQTKSQAATEYARLSALPKDQAAAQFDQISQDNPDLAKKIADLATNKSLNLSTYETSLKSASDATRAQLIYQKINSLPDQQSKAALWEDYVTKKIITAKVADQLTALLNGTATTSPNNP